MVDLCVHCLAEGGFTNETGEWEPLETQSLHHDILGRPESMHFLQQSDRHVHGSGRVAVEFLPVLLKTLDMLAVFHLTGESLLILGGEQMHLADLAEIHPYGVVDAFLLCQIGVNGDRLVALQLGPRPTLRPLPQRQRHLAGQTR